MAALKDYPHVSRFDDIPIIYASSVVDTDSNIAKASLDNLKNLLPNWRVDLEKNIDLLGIAFNAAVVNLANKNGDVMDTKTALGMADSFAAKFLNKEHKRDKIIGHIVNAGFSSYGESNILYSYDIAETQDPFNIALGAVVYKIVDRDYAAQIEDSANPESNNFQKLSASWEIGMANYQIAMGSPNLKEAEIVTDPKYIEELKSNLTVYGGNGKYNNAPIYRLIGRECIALGCAVTNRPAGNVTGLLSYKKPEEKVSRASFFGSFFQDSDKTKKTSVNKRNPMENLEKFLLELKASVEASSLEKKLKEETFATLQTSFSEQIKKASEEYVAKIGEAKAAKESAEKELSTIKATQEAQATELAATKAKLAELELKSTAEAAANLFSARMAEMDAEFDLTDEDREVLAADIKNLDETEAAWTYFKKKSGVVMKDKNKKVKEEKEKETKAAIDTAVANRLAEIAKASSKKGLTDKELAEKALEEAKASEKSVKLPNSNQSQSDQVSLKEKFAAAFTKENITVTL
jgi:hypothetical protein